MMKWLHELSEPAKQWIDAITIGVTISTILEVLPHATVVLSFIWAILRIYETRTVTSLIDRLRGRRPTVDKQSLETER